ncbi:MAG: nucleotidyl transferase AbiEii/AbiGii toxin family protein [Gammaproteobacteria bacterium]|nr:nucleotidyl transferase AbiEii/AbiGii toxin family protein [Gammaproteobacteria bacterium]MCY4282574.1 nucleotidyl transferase AbiEii/AbiGii toxin family protein [Gammaproteobacteria bacterium]MCY4339692.1 nucleotidyl transferase AbiEii/AbiGii toxin family protein [Gammaproteobacteria bacterium]
MTDRLYQELSAISRRDALKVVELNSNHTANFLEKDIWVVATLCALFNAPFSQYLIFKGGTSLSKVWRLIRRFSEDIDVTYDIRAFAPELVANSSDEALPPTRSQEKKWTRLIRRRLTEWVRDHARPVVEDGLVQAGFAAEVRSDAHCLLIHYEPLFRGTDFIRPEVKVEFGARSTGEPHTARPVLCDAATYLPEVVFPEASPTTMLAERTFWEKATAAHVFCLREKGRGERLSRHWHDLARLDEAGITESALADCELALSVARYKAIFFPENDAHAKRIDYQAAVSGSLCLIPSSSAYTVLAEDYARMLDDGMLLDENESFDSLMERCAAIEAQVNDGPRR